MPKKRRFILWKVAREKGFTVDRLARESGVNFNTVQNYMRRRKRTVDPGGQILLALAEALGVRVEDLYEEVPDEAEAEEQHRKTPSGARQAT